MGSTAVYKKKPCLLQVPVSTLVIFFIIVLSLFHKDIFIIETFVYCKYGCLPLRYNLYCGDFGFSQMRMSPIKTSIY